MGEELFPRMVEVLLPRGGVLLVLVEAYFDESFGTAKLANGRSVPVMCVAGYLVESGQAKALCDDWRAVLEPYGLPYFHMVDCAHGNGVFKGLSDRERSQIAARMIGNIKRRTIHGIAVAVNVQQWEALAPQSPILGSPYSFLLSVVIAGVQTWAGNKNYTGDIAYFFEAGHKSRSEANWIMEQTFAVPELKKDCRYVGHAFVEKAASPPVQAADLLAWQFYTDTRRQIQGTKIHRKDFASLIDHPHANVYVTPAMIEDLRREELFGSTPSHIINLFKGDLTREAAKNKPRPTSPSYSRKGPRA